MSLGFGSLAINLYYTRRRLPDTLCQGVNECKRLFSTGRGGRYNGNRPKAAWRTLMVDELNPQILSEWLPGMSLPERARALNRIAHSVTISAREFEAATQPFRDPAIVIKRLIGLSELQHQFSAQIGHYMDGEEIKVYPTDVFATAALLPQTR